MKTNRTAYRLGLYASECCTDELLFDINDHFSPCPKCKKTCRWNLVEQVFSWVDLDEVEPQAA